MYNAQDQHAEAKPLYKRALAINDKALGPDHATTRAAIAAALAAA